MRGSGLHFFLTVSFSPVKSVLYFAGLESNVTNAASVQNAAGLRGVVMNTTVVEKGILDVGHLSPAGLRNQFVLHLKECFIWKLEMEMEAYPWVCSNCS